MRVIATPAPAALFPCRETAIQQFNAPDSNAFIFLLSIRAAGRGLNLQSADTVVRHIRCPSMHISYMHLVDISQSQQVFHNKMHVEMPARCACCRSSMIQIQTLRTRSRPSRGHIASARRARCSTFANHCECHADATHPASLHHMQQFMPQLQLIVVATFGSYPVPESVQQHIWSEGFPIQDVVGTCPSSIHRMQVRVIHLEAVADADAFAVVDEAAGRPRAPPKVSVLRPAGLD
jgi:hypothetical protein